MAYSGNQVTSESPMAVPMAVRLGSFSGKTAANAVPISVLIDQKDLRLVRPRGLK
jgi:hypothetical protein